METKTVDVIIFGATGFTGKCVVQEMIKFTAAQELSWAIAGRNEEKLREVLAWASLQSGRDVSATVRVVIADCNDKDSLNSMASQTKAVINCCGPYIFYGESVVKACIQNGAHHVDVSGEPEFMEEMQLKYHQAATEKGVYVISACAFDSVPNDLGVVHFVKNFPGVVNSIESYVECLNETPEPAAHFTTWESIVNGLANVSHLNSLRSKVYSTLDKLDLKPALKTKYFIHRSPVFDNKMCLLFPGSDKAVVHRTQQSLYELYGQRPVQFRAYLIRHRLTVILGLVIAAFFVFALSQCAYGRKLLLKYPEFFTFGTISRKGPSEEARSRTFARFRFKGSGWSRDLIEMYKVPELINAPTNLIVVTEISFPDYAYGFTAKAVILGAITILKEYERMPLKGGVLTPGAAFAKTDFLENLTKHGVELKILS